MTIQLHFNKGYIYLIVPHDPSTSWIMPLAMVVAFDRNEGHWCHPQTVHVKDVNRAFE